MVRFWVTILERTRRSISSSLRSSLRSRVRMSSRTSFRSLRSRTPEAASSAPMRTWERWTTFSWLSFNARLLKDQLPFPDELLLDHLEHVVVLDAGPGHLVGVVVHDLADLVVELVLDLEVVGEGVADRLHERRPIVELDDLPADEPP